VKCVGSLYPWDQEYCSILIATAGVLETECNVEQSNIQRTVHRDIVFVIKTNEMHYFSNLFWYRTLHVSDRSTVHHQESSTVYTAVGISHTGYADCLLARSWSR